MVHLLDLPAAGTVSATVLDGTGVDIDVHLLSDYDLGSCLDRGDTYASAHMDAGLRYVIADSWVSSSGSVMDGPYDIEITYEAD